MHECAFDDLNPRLSLLCQVVGDDVIRPCKICRGCQIRVSISGPFIQSTCPIQSRVQSVSGVRSFYVERKLKVEKKNAIELVYFLLDYGGFYFAHIKEILIQSSQSTLGLLVPFWCWLDPQYQLLLSQVTVK